MVLGSLIHLRKIQFDIFPLSEKLLSTNMFGLSSGFQRQIVVGVVSLRNSTKQQRNNSCEQYNCNPYGKLVSL